MKTTSPKTTRRPKPSRRQARSQGKEWLDCIDRVNNVCRAIGMLSSLLANQSDERLEGKVVCLTGNAIGEQVEQLRGALADLEAAR